MDGPGIQQQPRAAEHVARKLRGVLAIEDVAVLVADVSPGQVDRFQQAQADDGRAGRRQDQVAQRVVLAEVSRGEDMHAGQLGGVLEVDADAVFVLLDAGDLERRRVRRLEAARLRQDVVLEGLAVGDSHLDDAGLALEDQAVVARGQLADGQQPAPQAQGVRMVLGVGPAAKLQQGEGVWRQLGGRLAQGQGQRVGRTAVQHSAAAVAHVDQAPRVRRPGGVGGLDPVDVGQVAQVNPSALVAPQGDRNRPAEFAVFDLEVNGLVRPRLARLAEGLQHVRPADVHQVHVLDLVGLVDVVEVEALRGREVLLSVPRDVLDLGLERELDGLEILAHREDADAVLVFLELEVVHLAGGGHAFAIDGVDDQRHLFQQSQRGGHAGDLQVGPDDHLGVLAPPQQAFALDVKARLQRVRFRLVGELIQAGEIAVDQDDRLGAGVGAEGNGDPPVLVRLVFLAGHHDPGVVELAVGLVEDGEHVPGGAGADQVSQRSLADEGPAGLAAADEVDDVDPVAVDGGELEGLAVAAQRGLLILVRAGVGGDQPVQVDARVHFLPGRAVVVLGVDAIDLDQQLLDVLEVNGELDGLVDGELFLVGEGEVDVNPVLELAVVLGAQHRVPLLHVAQPGQHLGLREDLLQVRLVDQFGVRLEGVFFQEEVVEAAADQGLVVLHGWQRGGRGEVGVQVGLLVGLVVLEILGPHVMDDSGQLQVGHEAVLVVHAAAAVQQEAVIQHVGLERVVHRRQARDKGPQPFQVLQPGLRVVLPAEVGTGLKLVKVGGDEGAVVEQAGVEFEQFVELRQQQLLVDGHRAEPPAVLVAQVGQHHLRKGRKGRVGHPRQQVAAPGGADVQLGQPGQGGVLEAVGRVAVFAQRPLGQRLTRDRLGVQFGRQARLASQDLALVVELDVEPADEEVQAARMVLRVAQQGLPVLHDGVALVVPVAADPLGDHLPGLVQIAGVLVVQDVVVVILLGARDQLLQGCLAVLGQGEVFDVPDLPGLKGRGRQEHCQRKDHAAFHVCFLSCCGPTYPLMRWTLHRKLRLDYPAARERTPQPNPLDARNSRRFHAGQLSVRNRPGTSRTGYSRSRLSPEDRSRTPAQRVEAPRGRQHQMWGARGHASGCPPTVARPPRRREHCPRPQAAPTMTVTVEASDVNEPHGVRGLL